MAGLNEDFFDLLSALQEAEAAFVIVGAHALAAHGVARATGDLDILVQPSPDNARRVLEALLRFGAPVADHGLTVKDLAPPGMVYQLGLPPRRSDLLPRIGGVEFDDLWAGRIEREVDGLRLAFPGLDDLVVNKRASGRPKDLLDVELLREAGLLDDLE